MLVIPITSFTMEHSIDEHTVARGVWGTRLQLLVAGDVGLLVISAFAGRNLF